MGNFGQDYLICTVASRRSTCSCRKSVQRRHVEAVIFDMLRNQLMQADDCAEFSTVFEEECANAEKQALDTDVTSHHELEKVRHKLDELVEAIASGL